jgi:LysM repeat protein
VQKTGDILAARAAFEQFIEHFPHSSKIDEAKDRLGEINTDIFLSTKPAPEKQEYIVRSGDVLNRVATKLKTTPELIMRANNLSGTMLRIGQKITIAPAEFSLFIDKGAKKVTLLNKGKFFKQYPIRSVPERLVPPKKGAAAPPPATGKITDKIAWSEAGERVIFSDKDYAGAAHWIVSSIGGHTLYSMAEEGEGKNYKTPPSGLGIAPEHAEELSAMLSKGTAVTIR